MVDGKLAQTAELSSYVGAISCPNSDTTGKKVGCAQVNGHKLDASRTAEGCCLLSWKGRSDWGRFLLAG